MTQPVYSLSFTTGGLFHLESMKLMELYAAHANWESVRQAVLANNLLQVRTQGTALRFTREIISRLRTLAPEEGTLLLQADYSDQKYILWAALCRRYTFIADFAVEVLHDRFVTLNNSIGQDVYDAFWNRKAEWHDEMNAIAPATKKKLRQVLFKTMREANVLEKNGTIIPMLPSNTMRRFLALSRYSDAAWFPVLPSEFAGAKA